jgi:hypothetical protein
MTDLPLHCSRELTKDEKLAEVQKLSRAYKQWHREQLNAALIGAHGAIVAELMTLLDRLELSSAAVLLDFIRRSDWSSVSYDTRLTVLHEINDRITRMRERHGLAPFDDPLPGQPENVFRIVRAILAPSPAHARRLSPSEVATAERIGRDVTATVSNRVSDDHDE